MDTIYVLGSINMDLVFEVDRIPNIGETRDSKHFFMTPGGKGANQAVACAKQGIQTYMIGSVGDDGLSQQCITSLQNHHVNCMYVKEIPNRNCGVAGIFLEDHDNRIVIHSGANNFHDTEEIKRILKETKGMNNYLVMQLEIPLDIIEFACVEAKKQGFTTVLNAAPAKILEDRLYRAIDMLIVNETEAEMLSGIQIDTIDTIHEAGLALLQKGVNTVIITLGERGSVYLDETQYIHVEAYPVDVVDTTAAGDTYIGILVTQLLKHTPIKDAMMQASAGASLAIQVKGAQVSIPAKEQIDIFLAERRKL